MKKLILLFVVSFYLFSCKTVESQTATNLSESSLVYTPTDSTERVITVFLDTSYVEERSLTLYKELVFSQGDSAVIYENELIIVDGVSYFAPETSTWFNVKAVKVYK